MYRQLISILVLSLAVPLLTVASASEQMSFGTGKIDYWQKNEVRSVAESVTTISAQKNDEKVDVQRFDWNKALDPKNDEFFKEGDYTPPKPFMEVARNPSDENIRLWNAYIEKKNLLASRLDARIREFNASRSGVEQPPLPLRSEPKHTEGSPQKKLETSRYQFRLYFDSECPHCKKMMFTMKELAESGFSVEAKQVDDKQISARGLPFAVTKASENEVKGHGISSVPFLLVGDLKKKTVYKMSGFKSVSSIFEEMDKAN